MGGERVLKQEWAVPVGVPVFSGRSQWNWAWYLLPFTRGKNAACAFCVCFLLTESIAGLSLRIFRKKHGITAYAPLRLLYYHSQRDSIESPNTKRQLFFRHRHLLFEEVRSGKSYCIFQLRGTSARQIISGVRNGSQSLDHSMSIERIRRGFRWERIGAIGLVTCRGVCRRRSRRNAGPCWRSRRYA